MKTTELTHATVLITDGKREEDDLKRLALFYDKICYILPSYSVLSESVLKDHG